MAELEDFEAFTEENFNAIEFASSLLQATNVVDDNELDLSTPIKKLQFDANECNKRMDSLTTNHHERLISNFEELEAKKRLMAEVVNPLAASLSSAFDRINSELIAPYEDAMKLNEALKKIHRTSMLLRGSSFFLAFLQQLQDCEKTLETADDNREVVRLAKLHQQIAQFYNNENLLVKDTAVDLLSIKLIRDYAPESERKSAQFSTSLSEKIMNDLGHHSSFVTDNSSLQHNLLAMYIMDQAELTTIIERGAMTKSIQIALSLLTRSLQSPRMLISSFAEVNQSTNAFVKTLTGLLAGCKIAKADPSAKHESLLQLYQESFQDYPGSSIEHTYWMRLSYKFKKTIAATMARGGPIARNLRSQYETVLASISSVMDGEAATLMKDALSIVDNQ